MPRYTRKRLTVALLYCASACVLVVHFSLRAHSKRETFSAQLIKLVDLYTLFDVLPKFPGTRGISIIVCNDDLMTLSDDYNDAI